MQVNPQQDTLYMLSRKKKFFLRKQEERKLRAAFKFEAFIQQLSSERQRIESCLNQALDFQGKQMRY